MGWKDSPLLEDEAKPVAGPRWASAPEVTAAAPRQAATFAERDRALATGIKRGLVGIAGLPMDTVQGAYNLGKAAIGVPLAAAGRADLAPEPVSGTPLSSEWFASKLEGAGVEMRNPRPDDQASRMLNTAGTVVGGSMVPGARPAPAAAAAAAGAIAGETLGPQYVGPAVMGTAGVASAAAASRGKTLAAREVQNAARDKTVASAREAGYVIPPSQSNPTFLNKLAEGFAGKITTAQLASVKNQKATNLIARQAVGLADDAPLTEKSLAAVRAEAGKHYQAVKDYGSEVNLRFKTDDFFRREIQAIGGDYAKAAQEFPSLASNKGVEALKKDLSAATMSPAAAVEVVKKLRFDASANFKSFDNPEKLALARAQRQAAEAVENLLERNLVASGQRDLVKNFRAARIVIARSHDIESALNETTGNVSTRVLAKIAEKGPVGGGLDVAAAFGNAFPKAAQNPETIGSTPYFSPLDFGYSGLGTLAGGMTANPALVALPVARPVVRSVVLSQPYQSTLGTPSYTPAVAPETGLASILRAIVTSNQEK